MRKNGKLVEEWLGRKGHGEILADFTVELCNMCGPMIRCPRCDNNTCNGGYGENGRCPVCPICYDLQKSLYEHMPKEIWESI